MMTEFQYHIENGQKYVLVPAADYTRLLQELEDAADVSAVMHHQAHPQPTIPGIVANAILDGDNPVRAWRQYRSMGVSELARRTGLSRGYVHAVEAGAKQMSVGTLVKVGEALDANIAFLISESEED